MPICIDPRKPLLPVRVVLIATLTLLVSGWSTCSVMGAFNSCQSSIAQPQVTSLSPGAIDIANESTLLQVNGRNFNAQSQIMWNGNGLPTTFVNSRLLETTITPQTFVSFGGAMGSTVQVSVMSGSVAAAGCPSSSGSASLLLIIQ